MTENLDPGLNNNCEPGIFQPPNKRQKTLLYDAHENQEDQCLVLSEEVDYKLCILCQTATRERLITGECGTGAGYELISKNLPEFHKLNALPFQLKPSLIAILADLKPVLTENAACWHKTCYLKICNMKLNRARESEKSVGTPTSPEEITETHGLGSCLFDKNTCIFCGLPSDSQQSNVLHSVKTKSCNDNIISYARKLNDVTLLRNFTNTCDLIMLEAKYHNICYIGYKRKALQNKVKHVQDTTFSEIVKDMVLQRKTVGENPIFNVVHLAKMQSERMKDLGIDYIERPCKLKEKLLREVPGLIDITKAGLPSMVTFASNLQEQISEKDQHSKRDESDTTAMSVVVKKIRRDMFIKNDENTEHVPHSLVDLIKMLIHGDSIDTSSSTRNKACQNIAELIVYHAIEDSKSSLYRKHNQYQETPGPVYLAAKLYATTRKKNLIDCTYKLGFSISYQRLLTIITEKAHKVCNVYETEQVVAPLKLQKGLFTTAAVDNVDHNPSSASAETAFHGTAITLMQHKMPDESGFPRSTYHEKEDGTCQVKNVLKLPEDYTVVPPCLIDIKKYNCTKTEVHSHEVLDSSLPLIEEQNWLEQTMSETFKQWPSYHSQYDKAAEGRHSTVVALLPIFKEQSHNADMMLHSMTVIKKTVQFLNPGQTPVLVADQPLYALLKQLQYVLPEMVGEQKLFVMMGGLHVEMAGLKAIGQWLKGSGWVEALIHANITSSGRAEAMLSASHITRTRNAHQVTAATLYTLQKKAYIATIDTEKSDMSFQEWREEKLNNVPQFKYWDIVLQLELLILQLVRSIRIGDFGTYMNSLRRLVPWFFSLDHNNYARWLSVHIRDLANLKENHPDILKHFEAGKFVARRTDRPFSAMALDQAHEQMNALIKGDGGMIGLTEHPDSLLKWLIAGPEIAALVEDFEHNTFEKSNDGFTGNKPFSQHHLDTVAEKNKFMKRVKALENTMNDLGGNPFLETSNEIYNIDSKKVACDGFLDTVNNIEKNGEAQYLNFCKERLQGSTNLQEPIKQNKYALFSTSPIKTSKDKAKLIGIKNDCSLFSKLFIATSEHRQADLDNFFAHENHTYPPALSNLGSLRSCNKSDLIKCLTNSCAESIASEAPKVTAKVLDGAAIIHMLNPRQSNTFGDYADNVFKPFVCRELNNVQRVDIVWDRYDENSIKFCTREKRGIGSRTLVTSNTRIPKLWANFLRENHNKEELFKLLSSVCGSIDVPAGKTLNITDGVNVLSSSDRCKKNIDPCNHEEADTRIMVHCADAIQDGHKNVMIRTVDTDVVVLAVSCVSKFKNLENLWVHIGTGKHHQYLSCGKIAASLGPERARAFPVFHALTGCDTVSAFSGRGKKTAFEAWNTYPAATGAFNLLADGDLEGGIEGVQKFIIRMYDKSSQCTSLNQCRRELFTKKDRQLENIPPTDASLKQHILRAMYQGVHIWGQTIDPNQNLPSPADWGWKRGPNNEWVPNWTAAPIAADACRELIRCRCKAQCGARCSCHKNKINCTELCQCSGKCANPC